MNDYLYQLKRIRRQPGVIILTALLYFFIAVSTAWCQNVITPGTTFTVVTGTTVISDESLVVKSGASLSNSGNLILKKDLTNEHAVPNSIGSGILEFSGVANQTISGLNILQNLVINNAAGITIGGNTSVNGVLTLTTGTVPLGANNLLLGPSATFAGSPSATAMVVATGTGELRKELTPGFTGVFTWPVGDNTGTPDYSPVTLTFTGGEFGTGNYAGVKLVNSAYPGSTGNYLNRYWTLTQNGITAPQFNAQFQYVPADVNGNENQISCYRVDPLPAVGFDPANAGLHQLTANSLPAFGTFTGAQTIITCTLAVTPENQSVPYAPAGSTTFSLTSNCSWTAVSDQTWCGVTPSGSGNGTITAGYAVHSGTSPRTANITVTVEGLSPVVVTVTQSESGNCAPLWQPVQNQQYSMKVAVNLYLSNGLTTNPADAIGAFVGEECRGIAYPDPAENGILFLKITSDVQSGETVTFRAWKSDFCEECKVAETMPFVSFLAVGTREDPFQFHCGMTRLWINFGPGWTWFSLNVGAPDMSVANVLGSLNSSEGDYIKNQTVSATYYDGFGWFGELTRIDPREMYKIKLGAAGSLIFDGLPIDPQSLPIPVNSGWNWIGYLPQAGQPVSSALTSINPVSDDYIKNQITSSTYYEGYGWFGELTDMKPLDGYMLKSSHAGTLMYAGGEPLKSLRQKTLREKTLRQKTLRQKTEDRRL